jgi:hypothetical protein
VSLPVLFCAESQALPQNSAMPTNAHNFLVKGVLSTGAPATPSF